MFSQANGLGNGEWAEDETSSKAKKRKEEEGGKRDNFSP